MPVEKNFHLKVIFSKQTKNAKGDYMIREKIAILAKKAENRISSFKINQKVCTVLAVAITLASVGISTNKLADSTTSVLALADNSTGLTEVVVIPTTTAPSVLDTDYKSNSFFRVSFVKHGGAKQTVTVRECTLKKALDAAHIIIGTSDVINYSLSDNIFDGMEVVIDEVKYKNETVTEKITLDEFKAAYPNESAENLDVNGKVRVDKTVKVKYVNGQKTEEQVMSISYKSVDVKEPTTAKATTVTTTTEKKTTTTKTTTTTTKKVTTTTEKTTKKAKTKKKSSKGYKNYSDLKTVSELKPSKDFKLDKNGIPVKYKKKITGTASAYSCGTHTATGKRVKPGYIAVNPRQIPYGTKLFIRSSDGSYVYGYASAEDTGGFVKWGNTVADLFFWSESACNQFGRRGIEIYVLD